MYALCDNNLRNWVFKTIYTPVVSYTIKLQNDYKAIRSLFMDFKISYTNYSSLRGIFWTLVAQILRILIFLSRN